MTPTMPSSGRPSMDPSNRSSSASEDAIPESQVHGGAPEADLEAVPESGVLPASSSSSSVEALRPTEDRMADRISGPVALSGLSSSSSDSAFPLTTRARAAFASLDFSTPDIFERPDLKKISPDSPTLPASVREAYDFYYNTAEVNDWGTARILSKKVDDEDVFAVVLTTDGDDAYLELYQDDGTALSSALCMAGDLPVWDDEFGAVRRSDGLNY